MGKKTPLNPKREGEKEDHEEQHILRLASWCHSYTVMNRPSRVEESPAWGSLLPWLQWIDPWKCNNSPTLMIRSAFPDIHFPSRIEGHCVPSTQDAFHYQSYSWTLMTSRCSCGIESESGEQWKWNEDWKPFVRIRPQASLFVLSISIPCMCE